MGKSILLAAIFFVFLIPLSYSITLQDLINFFNFDFLTVGINVTSQNDFMTDKDGNNLNDTLIIELATSGNAGNYLVVVDLYDENIITNETNKTLSSGTSKFNISFPAESLTKNKFNYTIKIYSEDYGLKYSKEGIETSYYPNYEEGVKIINISDKSIGSNSLQLNFAINFTKNNFYEIFAYLQYNGSIIFSKINGTANAGVNNIILNFDNETIKSTHYRGSFNLTSIKINNKLVKTGYTTDVYDYRDFAQTSYFSGFSDYGFDADNNGLSDLLRLNITLEIKNDDSYRVEAALYDLFGNFIEKKEKTWPFIAGTNHIILDFNGTNIYGKKLNGPYIVKYAKIMENNSVIDQVNNFYATKNYNYADFERPQLPDLNLAFEISDGYHYGSNNISLNVTMNNTGDKNAFNVFLEIFDNYTYSINKSITILPANEHKKYSVNFVNAPDFELNAIADFDDFVEESSEGNNIIKEIIKINKKPALEHIGNITVNETDTVIVTAAAADNNSDILTFSVNNTRFAQNNNNFLWHTTTMDSGSYAVEISASDGYLYDSKIFEIIVLDRIELDSDNDGINDSLDRLIGRPDSISTSTLNLSFSIGNSANLSRIFNGTQKVEFKDSSTTIVEFDFNFSSATINLSDIIINKQPDNSTGAIVFSIRNMALPAGFTKTFYLDKLNQSKNGICIRDMEMTSIAEISSGCNEEDEHKIECSGTLQDGYNCTYLNSTKKYKVTGLKNSGIRQIDFEKSSETATTPAAFGDGSSGSAGGGGSGSSGSGSCLENWQCISWSECVNNLQTRSCKDLNNCGTSFNKPTEAKACTPEKQALAVLEEKEEKNIEEGDKESKNNAKSSLQGITGLLSGPPADANPTIGVFIVFVVIVAGLFGYIYFTYKA
ncbi:hypothetical protein HYU50_01440 [Candidatus Woesearchaeota archaeon]|nr:hypothetical protein [Candidatus Woesearchaeota archaeon]